jgi:hypothetical protein
MDPRNEFIDVFDSLCRSIPKMGEADLVQPQEVNGDSGLRFPHGEIRELCHGKAGLRIFTVFAGRFFVRKHRAFWWQTGDITFVTCHQHNNPHFCAQW